jgi:hypothetical protein
MTDVAYVSVCFGAPEYFHQMDRLKKSILGFYPEAEKQLFFFRGHLPPGARLFSDSLYGFKPHAIQAAINAGYKKVLWLDPAMIMVDKIDDLLKFEMMAVKDDNVLYNVVSNRCYEYFDETQQNVYEEQWHLVGGSLYWFDFTKEATQKIFSEWLSAEEAGIFGSQQEQASEQLQGHRMDEAVMAIAMYQNGIEPVGPDVARYCYGDNSMFIKRHFK